MLDQTRRTKMYPVGFDTETTGLYSPKWRTVDGVYQVMPDDPKFCYPYLVTFVSHYDVFSSDPSFTFSEQGYEWVYSFRIDPLTRGLVPFNDEELDSIDQICHILYNPDILLVAHNAKFDLRMCMALLSKSSIPDHRLDLDKTFISSILKDRIDDTAIVYHAVDSYQLLELKPLAIKWVDIPEDDEEALKYYIDELRIKLANTKFKLASLDTFSYLSKAPSRGWYILDTWIPFAIDDEEGKRLAIQYCVTDSWRTLLLWEKGIGILEERGITKQYDQNRASLYPTYWIEDEGFPISIPSLLIKREELIEERNAILRRVNEIYANTCPPAPTDRWSKLRRPVVPEININSDDQLADFLFTRLDVNCRFFTKGGKPSVKISYLLQYFLEKGISDLAKEVIGCVIAHRKYEKVLQYLKSYTRRVYCGRLYPSYNTTGTSTLRLSSSDPNGQNIAKGGLAGKNDLETAALKLVVTKDISIRSVFQPEVGTEWYAIDYKQLQLVIFAILTGDEQMIAAIERGDHFHTFMAKTIYGLSQNEKPSEAQKRVAKAVNFGFIFGAGDAKIESTASFKGLTDLLRHIFPRATQFIKDNMRLVQNEGVITTANGYPLTVPADKPHAATNFKIQGTEGELVKLALVDLACFFEDIGVGTIICTVHDEIVVAFKEGEGEEYIASVVGIMEEVGNKIEVKIPLSVDVKLIKHGSSWAKGETIEI